MKRRCWWLGALAVVVLLVAATASWAYYPRPNYHGVRLGASPLVDCWDCHWFSQENAFNVLRVSPLVLGPPPEPPSPPGTLKSVSYTGGGDLVKPDRTGVCQVCHSQTKYYGYNYDWKAPATGPHYDTDCRGCHPHWPTDPAMGLFDFTMVGPESHATHLTDCKGPRLSACTDCHNSTDFTRFYDGLSITTTTICNPCHSPNGPVDGVNDPVVGAKPNWTGIVDGVYDGDQLKPGKEHWCDGCHDSGTSVVNSVQAPNILGNNASYGYNVTGHGRNPAGYVLCLDCHTAACTDPDFEHCDGDARTYDRSVWPANPSNYVPGYRLADYMNIPKWNDYGSPQYDLCFNCHDAAEIFDGGGTSGTNFRNDRRQLWNYRWNANLHYLHLMPPPPGVGGLGPLWDSDWDGLNTEGGGDSTVSCPACHNVHGSATPKMTRNGELVSTHPDLDFVWYSNYDLVTRLGSGTNILTDSRWGTSDITVGFTSNHICTGCHGSTSYSYFRVPHEVLVPDPSLPAPQPLVNALVWTSNTADTPQTQFTRNSTVRVHVVYYVCPFNTPPPYNVIRRLKINAWSINKANTATGQLEGAYTYPPTASSTPWDITVPTSAASGNTPVQVIIRSNGIGGTDYIETKNVTIRVVP
jgi:hypothetical protein